MSPLARHGRLAVRGHTLVNERGTPVQLRGMSLFWSQWSSDFYRPAWVARLAREWRVDVIRACLGVGPDGYLAAPKHEMAKVVTVIEAALAHGLYVIVDWHSHRAETEAARIFFRTIAAHYGHHSNLLYELWNEPRDEDWSGAIVPHHRAVLEVLRAEGAAGVAICGTGDYCRDLEAAMRMPLEAPNIAYGLHFYAGTHREGLRRRIDRARAAGLCIFVSEYGLSESCGNGILDLEEMKRWWHFLDQRGISHVNWSLHDKRETSAALRRHILGHGLSPSGQAVKRYLRGASRPASAAPDGFSQDRHPASFRNNHPHTEAGRYDEPRHGR